MEQIETTSQQSESEAAERLLLISRLRRELADLMTVEDHVVVQGPDRVVAFRGHVHGDTEDAFERMTERFARQGYTVQLRDGAEGRHEVFAIKGLVKGKPGRVWVNVALFAATVLSVLFIGARTDLQYTGAFDAVTDSDLSRQLWLMPLANLHRGLPFAATLLGILVTHELSHYVVGRRYGSPSLPYFIPMPEGYLGTMGAVIVQRSPTRSRKAIFDMGIAGPLGGLIVAIPLLVVGLALSEVMPTPTGMGAVLQEGNSLLYALIKYLMFGKWLPGGGEDVWLHPVAFAAWAGLLVTMINLIPVGQLDGGHISYALLGKHARRVSLVLIGLMVAWGSWLLSRGNNAGWLWTSWGVLNAMLNVQHPPLLDDATRLNGKRVVAGIGMLLIFILLLIPAPLSIIILP